MLELPKQELSYWRESAADTSYPVLRESIQTDVAIVGGGIAGLTTAYLLKRSGLKVVVLDKGTIGSGTTGHTTGKVTSQHNFIYQEMIQRLGKEKTKLYGQANNDAIGQIEKIIKREKISCGWQREDSYIYTDEWRQIKPFKKEAALAASLGLPASFEDKLALPFIVRAAVKFSGQAHMNAQAYINGLAAAVDGDGCHVFEGSHVIGIRDGEPGKVRTRRGAVVAKDIIVATNVPTLPLMARGTYCAFEYPHKSYIIACRLPSKLRGMYISPDQNHYSVLPVSTGSGQLVLVGGGNHIPGTHRSMPRYETLACYAEDKLEAEAVEYRWSARDYIAYDQLPLVGKLYPRSKHLYVATAFKKWGLTNTMVAANILHDIITGRPNSLINLWSPNRPGLIRSFPYMAKKEIG